MCANNECVKLIYIMCKIIMHNDQYNGLSFVRGLHV